MGQTPSETLQQLLEISRLLSSTLEIGELLRIVLGLASRVVGAETASLLLLDEKTRELYFDVALGLGEEASQVRLKLGEGIAGWVAEERKPAIINDARSDPRWSAAMDRRSGFVTRSILAAPMTIKGRLIGVVEAINKRQGGFSQEDLGAFEAFASQASVAIENARLFSSLKEEKFKLDTVFTEMTDGAILTDAEGRILIANPAARKLMGVGVQPASVAEALRDMAVTPSLREIFASSAPALDFAAARERPKNLVLAGKAARLNLAVEAPGRSGSRETGRTGWLWVLRDETEEWQKERLKRSFLSLISHKLRTPLASVTGYAEILLEEFKSSPPPPMHQKAVESISAQGQKLSNLVDKLLRYTTLENPEAALEMVPCPVDSLVSEVLKSMKSWLEEQKASVAHSPDAAAVVTGDRKQLAEVVKNLVENAVKFDPKPAKKVAVSVSASGDEAVLRVKDTGPGIPPEDQDKVFSRFHQIEASFTGQVEGWGLGLPFVKKVAEGHGGRVELESKLGEGTTVAVFLPRRGK